MDYLATLAPSSLEERIVQVLASGPATRGDLCARLDVSRTVLGRALAELRQDGAVRVVAYRSHSEGRGRPVEQLGLAERIACAVGLDVSRTSASGIILDRRGEVLASVLTPLSFDGWREPLSEAVPGPQGQGRRRRSGHVLRLAGRCRAARAGGAGDRAGNRPR